MIAAVTGRKRNHGTRTKERLLEDIAMEAPEILRKALADSAP